MTMLPRWEQDFHNAAFVSLLLCCLPVVCVGVYSLEMRRRLLLLPVVNVVCAKLYDSADFTSAKSTAELLVRRAFRFRTLRVRWPNSR